MARAKDSESADGHGEHPRPAGEGRALPRGQRTRRRLLDAAELMFGEYGFYDASIARITEQAGVAQGTFYLYFKSKQEIFEEVVADMNQQVRRAMATAAEGAVTRFEAERLGFEAFFRFTGEHPALFRVVREAEFVAPRAMRQHYERIVAGYVPALSDGMSSGEVAEVDPAVLAWALMAVGEIAGMRFVLWERRKTISPAVFEQLMTIVWRMLGSPEEAVGRSVGSAGRR
jgi:AcrR family transcriptional regulator